jgi:hypothetical protein
MLFGEVRICGDDVHLLGWSLRNHCGHEPLRVRPLMVSSSRLSGFRGSVTLPV